MSFACAYRNSNNVSGWNECIRTNLSSLVDVFSGVCASIASSRISSSSALLSSPFEASRYNTSAVLRLIPTH